MNSSQQVSFYTRLGIFFILWYQSSSILWGIFLYYFLDLIVVDYILRRVFGLVQIDAGIDSYMVQNNVNTIFYVIMDRRIESVGEIKKQILSQSIGLDRFQSTFVEILGKYYLKRIVGEQLKDEIAKAFV